MLAWPSFCVDMNRAEEVQLFRKSREVSLRSNGGGGGGYRDSVVSVGGVRDGAVLNEPKGRPSPTTTATAASGCSEEESNDERHRHRPQQHAKQQLQATAAEQVRPHHHRRMPRFGEAHHRRVPTPMKKRRKPREDFTDPPTPSSDADDAAIVEVVAAGDAKPPAPPGVPDPYYPIYLPIDQAFKAKYVFHQRKGKTFQEKVYVFLEHPCGWICFIYHFAV